MTSIKQWFSLVVALLVLVSAAVPIYAVTPVPDLGSEPARTNAKSPAFDGLVPLDDESLDQIQGTGFFSTVGAFVAGGLGGASYYTAGYAYDRYVNHRARRWSWRTFGRETFAGAAGMAVSTTVYAWWAP